jgi:hypothetical protein
MEILHAINCTNDRDWKNFNRDRLKIFQKKISEFFFRNFFKKTHLSISDILLPATRVPHVMPELALQQFVTGKDRAVAADAETGRVDAAGSADPETALHVPVQGELGLMGYALLLDLGKHGPHHHLPPADRDPIIGTEVQIVHEQGYKALCPERPVIRCDQYIGALVQLVDKEELALGFCAKQKRHDAVSPG